METIEIRLDKQTFERALQIAKKRHSSLEDLIKEIVERIGKFESGKDPFLGMFADEAELMDQIIESIMSARESHALRK